MTAPIPSNGSTEYTTHDAFVNMALTIPADSALADSFPNISPNIEPFTDNVIVQMKLPRTKSRGGIILHTEVQDQQQYNEQIGRVVAIGPDCFKKITLGGTDRVYTEYYKVGDYVRTPLYGGDKNWRKIPNDAENRKVCFAIFKWDELKGKITGSPLDIET